MIPVLYEKNETEFVTNGIGRLSEVVSCTVEEVLNGKYELQMQYPVGGKLYDNIKHSAIIYALPSDGAEEQPFRIYRISKPINGIVTIYAEHISYQLSHVTVSPYEAESIAGALNGIKINAADDCPFEFWTDKGTVADFSLSVPASGRSILGGMEGSVLDVYGGEYEFDRYKVKLHEHRGRDRGVSLRYGKNITDITQEENISNTITGVYPYWANTSGEYIELPEKVLYADNADNFPFRRTIPLDCSGDFQSAPTVAQLREKGIAYITKSGIGIPKVSIKVSFVALWQTEEYKDIALLERVKLGDTVSIEFETLNVSATAKVSKTVYDVLKERYEKIELGDAKTNLSKVVADQQKELNSKASGAYIKWAVDQATDLITGVDGGNVVIRRDANGKPYEILIMDTDDVNTAKHVWRWNKNGWGYSSDGYNGPFTLAATINGGIVADAITSGKIEARNSAGNVVFSVNVGTGEVYISGDVIRIGGKTLAQALEDSKALQVLISNEYQGIPTDSDGNYTTFPECSTAIQVLYGQTDITAQCTLTATTSTGVTAALTGTTLKVTALAADTGWVDIKATYLGTMTATKRFNLSKVKDGSQGSNVKILNTEISMTQEEIATNSAMGYVRNWTVITLTDGLKAGDNVMLQVYNDTKGGEAYILATVNEVLSEYRINTTSAGLLDKGEQGKDGTTARTYILEPSVTTIKRGQDNVPVPDEIAFSAYYRDGTSASRTAYAGRFKIEKSTDGNTWSTVYISSANETSCRYELYTAIEDGNGNYLEDGNGNVIVAWYDEDAVMFRGTLYAAGGTTSALDMQTVPVVIDVAALTHEQIFNLLTNNGAWQGIFYLNGKMYVSGEYIAANSITADKLSVTDLYALAAKIGGWNINNQAIYKDVVDPNDENIVYRVYLQPPLATNLDSTWILSCQKSSDGGKTFSGNFILFSDGSVRYGGSDYYIQMNPSGDNPYTVVFGTVEKNESGSYNHVTYIRANGEMHTRKLIIASSPTYPHIVGDGTYLQMSPVDGTDWGIVAEYKDATQYLRPANSGQVGLGREAFKWGQIWSSNSTISTSDKREKNTITPLEDDRWTQFLLGLEVVSYRLNDGTSGRLHHGLIANDVEELMNRLGIDSSEFAGFVKWQRTEQEEEEEIVTDEKGKKRKRKRFKDIPICDKDGNPEYGYGLRYEEFLPMTIKAVQGLYQENEKLKEELKAMKKDIKELKQMMKEVG